MKFAPKLKLVLMDFSFGRFSGCNFKDAGKTEKGCG